MTSSKGVKAGFFFDIGEERDQRAPEQHKDLSHFSIHTFCYPSSATLFGRATQMFFSIVSFLYLILRIEGYSTSNNSSGGIEKTVLNSSTEPRFRRKLETPTRALQAPFPDGLNGGNLITLPPRKHYLKQKSSSNLGTDLADSFILPPRDVKVWTPPQYNDPKYSDVRYPVLYVHDGQNAMQDSSSWTGYSWRLAGALTRMAERKQLKTNEHSFPPIVVMIPSATDRLAFVPRRHLEYGDISTAFSQGKVLKCVSLMYFMCVF